MRITTDIEKAKALNVREVAEQFGVKFTHDNRCLCFVHGEKNPSMSVYRNKLKCFSCGSTMSSIDVFMFFTGESDVIKASKRLLNEECTTPIVKAKVIAEADEKADKKKKYEHKKQELITKDSATVQKFLEDRSLLTAKEILHANGMDVLIDKYGQICFISEKHQWIQCRGHDHHKYNFGTVPILFLQALKPSDTWLICEGLTDSLTALEMGFNSVCLNSINNTTHFVALLNKRIERGKVKQKFIIALDTDDRAEHCIYQLIDFFLASGVLFDLYEPLYQSSCKDLNEFYVRK